MEESGNRAKKEDEICTSSLSSSTIPLTSGIEEAPQLLLSVVLFYHIVVVVCKPQGPGPEDPAPTTRTRATLLLIV